MLRVKGFLFKNLEACFGVRLQFVSVIESLRRDLKRKLLASLFVNSGVKKVWQWSIDITKSLFREARIETLGRHNCTWILKCAFCYCHDTVISTVSKRWPRHVSRFDSSNFSRVCSEWNSSCHENRPNFSLEPRGPRTCNNSRRRPSCQRTIVVFENATLKKCTVRFPSLQPWTETEKFPGSAVASYAANSMGKRSSKKWG